MTLQHATIAEKIPVLIKVVFLFKIFCGIFIFESASLILQYTQ